MMDHRFLLTAAIFAYAAPAHSATIVFQCKYDAFCSSDGCEGAELSLEFNVDEATGDAFIIGNNGLSNVVPIRGEAGVTFLESLASGAIQSTTYSLDGQSVHSRHTIIGEQLAASQYYGSCKVGER